MSKKKHPVKCSPEPSKALPEAEAVKAASPYLPVAHPPARNQTWLAVSVILFVVWFLFLLMAAISG
jgi:hypothetical protein